ALRAGVALPLRGERKEGGCATRLRSLLRKEGDGPSAALPDRRDFVPLPGFRFAPAWPAGPLRSPA
ncbi:hypothetical protein, partial [Streptomyces sp. NBC_00566]|uniref:hypothetical protein n=1 Tax=Streptomyces sp. NBC_00566 TaxID=2975778 RepID=UPI002E8222B7